MDGTFEYMIYIGLSDAQLRNQIVTEQELRETVAGFFVRNRTGFSMLSAKGGYLHKDGWYISENTLCIHIIGAEESDILRLAKNLSMYMNQESALVTRTPVLSDFHRGAV